VPDGFCLFQLSGAAPQALRVLFVAHLDEIGGCVYGPRDEPPGSYDARWWGAEPEAFAAANLQAFDVLATDPSSAFTVRAELAPDGRLVVLGDGVRPYRTMWTYREAVALQNDLVEGKALDPRATVYAVTEATRALDNPSVGALFVMAEECDVHVAQRAVAFLSRRAPDLRVVANADVPDLKALGEGRLDTPALRIYEGHALVDPTFGVRAAEELQRRGMHLHLTGARSSSQTSLFRALAPTLSVAIPCDGVHQPRGRMSLTGIQRCTDLLVAIGQMALGGPMEIETLQV